MQFPMFPNAFIEFTKQRSPYSKQNLNVMVARHNRKKKVSLLDIRTDITKKLHQKSVKTNHPRLQPNKQEHNLLRKNLRAITSDH